MLDVAGGGSVDVRVLVLQHRRRTGMGTVRRFSRIVVAAQGHVGTDQGGTARVQGPPPHSTHVVRARIHVETRTDTTVAGVQQGVRVEQRLERRRRLWIVGRKGHNGHGRDETTLAGPVTLKLSGVEIDAGRERWKRDVGRAHGCERGEDTTPTHTHNHIATHVA
jgi:hypothetical protein